ncbi:ABC transporter permease [Isoptericola sp. b441]|uniref:Transport permease protein n=1 Tax=Actinotalea lenta TaxID=3064654 RepID=A0ABT9D5I3_9CELL|nr:MULTISPECIES: ABC transporter permease [unclassified Isoptericola]MDO8106040.1 ABC transporter permease [Isoptericola sp. b441]MDO8122241.1 ABC transporter permease [Isoptericola sp. b490]
MRREAAVAVGVRVGPGDARDAAGRFAAMVRMGMTLMLREPGPIVSRLVMPVVLMILLRPLYEAAAGDGTARSVTGMAVMFSLLALSMVASGIVSERTWRTWDRLRTSPTSPAEMLAAKAVPALGFLVAQQGVVLGFGAALLGLRVGHPWLLLVAESAWLVMLLAIGMALATLVRSRDELAAAQDVGGLVLTGLGGALVPLTLLPTAVQHVAPISPGYWGMAGLTGALAGDAAAVWRSVAVLIAVASAAWVLAVWRVRQGWTRHDRL